MLFRQPPFLCLFTALYSRNTIRTYIGPLCNLGSLIRWFDVKLSSKLKFLRASGTIFDKLSVVWASVSHWAFLKWDTYQGGNGTSTIENLWQAQDHSGHELRAWSLDGYKRPDLLGRWGFWLRTCHGHHSKWDPSSVVSPLKSLKLSSGKLNCEADLREQVWGRVSFLQALNLQAVDLSRVKGTLECLDKEDLPRWSVTDFSYSNLVIGRNSCVLQSIFFHWWWCEEYYVWCLH